MSGTSTPYYLIIQSLMTYPSSNLSLCQGLSSKRPRTRVYLTEITAWKDQATSAYPNELEENQTQMQ
jgi:hypothetical protein